MLLVSELKLEGGPDCSENGKNPEASRWLRG